MSSQKDLVEMFLDDARITARISHPYVCSVMDIGTHDGVPYVTMDYLVGEPLLRLGPRMADDRSEASLANVVRVITNLCEGLHAAHERGTSAASCTWCTATSRSACRCRSRACGRRASPCCKAW